MHPIYVPQGANQANASPHTNRCLKNCIWFFPPYMFAVRNTKIPRQTQLLSKV